MGAPQVRVVEGLEMPLGVLKLRPAAQVVQPGAGVVKGLFARRRVQGAALHLMPIVKLYALYSLYIGSV